MNELISREAALKAVNAYDGCAEELRKLPAIDAEPVRRGKWLKGDPTGVNPYMASCSECGKLGLFDWVCCSHCGAKMGGDG